MSNTSLRFYRFYFERKNQAVASDHWAKLVMRDIHFRACFQRGGSKLAELAELLECRFINTYYTTY